MSKSQTSVGPRWTPLECRWTHRSTRSELATPFDPFHAKRSTCGVETDVQQPDSQTRNGSLEPSSSHHNKTSARRVSRQRPPKKAPFSGPVGALACFLADFLRGRIHQQLPSSNSSMPGETLVQRHFLRPDIGVSARLGVAREIGRHRNPSKTLYSIGVYLPAWWLDGSYIYIYMYFIYVYLYIINLSIYIIYILYYIYIAIECSKGNPIIFGPGSGEVRPSSSAQSILVCQVKESPEELDICGVWESQISHEVLQLALHG